MTFDLIFEKGGAGARDAPDGGAVPQRGSAQRSNKKTSRREERTRSLDVVSSKRDAQGEMQVRIVKAEDRG